MNEQQELMAVSGKNNPAVKSLAGSAALFLRFGSPRLLLVQLLVAIPLRMILGKPSWAEAAIVAGVFVFWPLQEWFLHQRLLHFTPRKVGPFWIDPAAARKHRSHHREPWRLDTCFLPTALIVALIPVHVVLWWALTPSWSVALTGVIAMGMAALIYEWIHFLTHTTYRPTSRYFRRVLQNHRLHHFHNEHHWHSFTLPWLDQWMGTGGDPRSVERSATCRTLGVDE